jgi:hypothetical protein
MTAIGDTKWISFLQMASGFRVADSLRSIKNKKRKVLRTDHAGCLSGKRRRTLESGTSELRTSETLNPELLKP